MTHVNHQRNKFSEDSLNRHTPSNNAALRGALLAFARPQPALGHLPLAPLQDVKAANAATLAFKDQPEVRRPTVVTSAVSQSTYSRQSSPSRSHTSERRYDHRHALTVASTSAPRARSPLSTAASAAAYRLSPHSTGCRRSSAYSNPHHAEVSEQEDAEQQVASAQTTSEVKQWLEDLNKPRPPPRFFAPKPFRRGMTLRPTLAGPSGTAVASPEAASPVAGTFRNFVQQQDSDSIVKSSSHVRNSSAAFSFGTTTFPASVRSLSTGIGHDGGSEFGLYEPSSYGLDHAGPVEVLPRSTDENESSEESGLDQHDMHHDHFHGQLSVNDIEPAPDYVSEGSGHSLTITAPIPIPPGRLHLEVDLITTRPSMSARPQSFMSETTAAFSLMSFPTGQLPPRLSTSAWQSPSSMSTGNISGAVIASTVAISRAPSPLKSPLRPVPLTRRYTEQDRPRRPAHKSKLRLGRKGARSPSPPRGMLQTLRKERSSSSEDESRHLRKEKHRFHLRKHPNKHHEGDRRRWRDEITPRELRRYEGVWAANRGLLLTLGGTDTEHNTTADQVKAFVSNLVVRDLWLRSRLPANVLEEVWDLVDRDGAGRLNKDQFVVGMWLIDQRLKGRKLPVKVSHSVWASARGLYGLKMPRLKG